MFTSKSGFAFEDDMVVTLHRADGHQVTLALEPAMYEPRGLLDNVVSVCERVAGIDVGGNRVLFLLSRNYRPAWDRLDAALVDFSNMHVIDLKLDVGKIKTFDKVFALKPVGPASFAVRLIRERIADSGCDCEAAEIEDWHLVTVTGNAISTSWQHP